MEEKISIVVPIFNTPIEYLEKCIESLTGQTYQNVEILLILDGATEECVECCKRFQQKDSRIRVIEKENEGVSATRNLGISKAEGKWIMFVDSDDWIDKDSCQVLYNAIVSANTEVVIAQFNLYQNGEIKAQHSKVSDKIISSMPERKELIKSLFFDANCMYSYIEGPVAKIYNIEFLKKNNLEFNSKLKVGEDVSFNYQVDMLAKEIVIISDNIYYYRIYDGSVSQKFDKDFVLDYTKFLLYIKQLFEKNKEKEEIYNFFVVRQIEKMLKRYYFNVNNARNSKAIKKEFWQTMKCEPYKTTIKTVKYGELNRKRAVLVWLIRKKWYFLINLLMRI
jgi:glycosyltransferase involved in cell wall biosynthesis